MRPSTFNKSLNKKSWNKIKGKKKKQYCKMSKAMMSGEKSIQVIQDEY